jgi:transcriptional regulator with XRE-family HTH domain
VTPVAEEERVLASAFAARIRELREQRGLSHERLAWAAGVSSSSLSRGQSGARRITLALIQRLTFALNVTHDELLGGLPTLSERHGAASHTEASCDTPKAHPPSADPGDRNSAVVEDKAKRSEVIDADGFDR